ncbi:MAG: hypothetical protein CVU05_07520 [Bacteroidetes bacterium HGW-Bacteroidetes-21]|nr:MAG: hypothetical protein CVU05_07520 [Bacteroidetes bacterium HGW-Bacteroidetes-21]
MYGQVDEIDTIQWLIFDKFPDQIIGIENKESIQPIRHINLKVKELTPISNNDSVVKYMDEIKNKEIIIYKKVFQPDKHTYDFEKNLIDGKIAFGHDGFSSKEYVNINFRSELAGIKIIDNNTQASINIVNSNFPLFIHPYLTNNTGICSVKFFRVEKYFKYVLVITGGGGGAGSYESYILIDIYDRGWIFAKNIYLETFDFVPISNQKDPFIKKEKKIWYQILLK